MLSVEELVLFCQSVSRKFAHIPFGEEHHVRVRVIVFCVLLFFTGLKFSQMLLLTNQNVRDFIEKGNFKLEGEGQVWYINVENYDGTLDFIKKEFYGYFDYLLKENKYNTLFFSNRSKHGEATKVLARETISRQVNFYLKRFSVELKKQLSLYSFTRAR